MSQEAIIRLAGKLLGGYILAAPSHPVRLMLIECWRFISLSLCFQGEVLYRVRWKNYCSDDDTWEPEAHLEDCREVLLAFKKNMAEIKLKKEAEAKKPPVRLSDSLRNRVSLVLYSLY